jgi:hypothetical protein
MSQKHYDVMLEKCTRRKKIDMPNIVNKELDATSTGNSEETKNETSSDVEIDSKDERKKDEDSSDDGEWDLFKILSIKEVTCECPIKCYIDDCPRPAAVAYVSKTDPNEKWYGCLDCQVSNASYKSACNQEQYKY